MSKGNPDYHSATEGTLAEYLTRLDALCSAVQMNANKSAEAVGHLVAASRQPGVVISCDDVLNVVREIFRGVLVQSEFAEFSAEIIEQLSDRITELESELDQIKADRIADNDPWNLFGSSDD